jgi:hypothetical protein
VVDSHVHDDVSFAGFAQRARCRAAIELTCLRRVGGWTPPLSLRQHQHGSRRPNAAATSTDAIGAVGKRLQRWHQFKSPGQWGIRGPC